MSLTIESPWEYYDYYPLTESVAEEFWSRPEDRILWVGDVERAGKRGREYLPQALGPSVLLMDGMYERILAVDLAVIPVRATVDAMVGGSVYLPLVCVRAAVGTWLSAMSFLALDSIEDIVKGAGRPPWPEPVEIQSVWGRGFGRAQCVALRSGLRSSVRRK